MFWKKFTAFSFATMLLLASFSVFTSGFAATATDAYDQPSTLKVSTDSNHSFSITSPSGVAEGETIVITFPTDFDTSSIIEDDVDVADDTVDLTTAANCTGSEEASVAMAADVLTITICSGDGGAISAASVISIEIGTNAAASGTGSNKITNPTSVGTYFVDVAGTFGDTASIPIPIITDDDSAFSGIVPSSGGDGGDGGGGEDPPPSSTIEVTAPVGGEVMNAGDEFTVSWSSVGSVAEVNLYYSIDNGSSYSVLSSGESANGTYDWTVPDVSTTEALIRAEGTDLVEVIASDSSGVFSIIGTEVEQTVTVSSPNGGGTFNAGDAHDITWTSEGDVTAIDIYYSTDGGETYSLIASNEDNDGSYSWTVPDEDSALARIRIDARDDVGVVAQDTSDGTFTLTPAPVVNTVTVLRPNGGEILNADAVFPIAWTSSGDVDEVDLYYSLDNGTSYDVLAFGLIPVGSYNWTVPNVDSDQVLIRVDGTIDDVPVVIDESDAVFTIVASEDDYAITITTPNGDESWETETNNVVSWSTRGEIEVVDLYYSDDGGLNYYRIETDLENTGGYLWLTPMSASEQMLIRVDGKTDNVILASDTSDNEFTITQADEEDVDEDEDEEEDEDEDEDEDIDEDVVDEDRSLEVNLIVGRSIVLDSDDSSFSVLSSTSGIVDVLATGGDISNVHITFGDTDYAVTDLGNGAYQTIVFFGTSTSVLTVSVDYEDGETLTDVYSVVPSSAGMLFETVGDERVPVSGAVVIVYTSDTTQWPGSMYGQANPLLTNSSGAMLWYVPNGSYSVTFGKTGYHDAEMKVRVRDNILNPSFELVSEEVIIEEPDEDDTAVIAAITDVTDVVAEQISVVTERISETIEAVRDIPEVQTVATVVTPIIVASAIGGTVVLASSFSLFPFLQYLFTAPLLFFARRRRQQFGVVYNAFTKVPVDLAIVRLYSEAGKLVKTMVTDQEGRYFFQTDPGFYRIQVVKDGFEFPSVTLKGQHQDGNYLDVYTGDLIEVTDKAAIISANIPVEPVQALSKITPRKVYLRRFLRIFQRLIGFTGLILAFFVWIIQPSALTLGILVFQVVVLLVTMYLIRPKRKKGWGIVYEKIDGKSIKNTIVRLYEPKYNKLLETTITDGKGRYAFLAGQNEYYVTYEKPGFQKQTVSPVDYTKNEKPAFITVDVAMQKTA